MRHADHKLNWTVGYAEEQLNAARLAKQEHIIKLLEKQMEDCCSYGPSTCFKCEVVAKSIALIEGENK